MFTAADWFVLRSPLLAVDEARDLDLARLRELAARPEVREALFVASPSLVAELDRCGHGAWSDSMVRSVLRYVLRMTYRTTPFGLFAGVAVGARGDATRLELASREHYRRHTRLDGGTLEAVCTQLRATPDAVTGATRFTSNPTLHRHAGVLRFVDLAGAHATVDDSSATAALRERAASSATQRELVDAVCALDAELEVAEVEAFVQQVVDTGILVTDLAPVVTGEDDVARRSPVVARAVAALARADHRLEGDRAALAEALEAVRSLGVAVGPERLAQVEMTKPCSATLDAVTLERIRDAVIALHAVAPPMADRLATFRAELTHRHQSREVPLAEVLDPELGIGFRVDVGEPGFGERERLLLRLIQRGDTTMRLDRRAIEALSTEKAPLPDSFAATVRLAGDRLVLLNANGPSAARVLGRFAHAEQGLATKLRQHLRAEEALQPEVAFAEVVYLPNGRTNNILARPVLRDREVVIRGRSGAPADQQLTLDDLRVSVRNDRVILRSASLDREVAPRLASAHVFELPEWHPAYAFLGMLQGQDTHPAEWSWGALAGLAFLPRVEIGDVVVSRARWQLADTDLELPLDEVRIARRLPRWIAVVEGSEELVLDLEHPMCQALFEHSRELAHKAGKSLSIAEVLPAPDDAVAFGPEGRFVSELVVPFLRDTPRPRVAAAACTHSPQYMPGSGWLDAAIYAAPSRLDDVLAASGAVARATACDEWHAIRVIGRPSHLRVRFRADPARLLGETLPALHALTSSVVGVWRMELGSCAFDELLPFAHADTEEVLGQLEAWGEGDRTALAVRSFDALLAGQGLDLAGRLDFVRRESTALVARRRTDVHELGRAFRAQRIALERALTERLPLSTVAVAPSRLLPALVHARANRLFVDQSQRRLIVALDALRRLYEGMRARGPARRASSQETQSSSAPPHRM